MTWEIDSAVEGDLWFAEYVDSCVNGATCPRHSHRGAPTIEALGDVKIYLEELDPGVYKISTQGGSVDDRALAEYIARHDLRAAGYEQAQFYIEPQGMTRTSDWNDIMAKAKRLVQSGNVTLLRNGYNNIVAHVKGDHGEYQSEISRDDPDSRVITQWTCECPWDTFAFQRTRQWKKYEGRPCAHVLAAFWKSLATPLDEQIKPMGPPQGPAVPPGGQGQLPVPGQGPAMMPGMGEAPSQPPAPSPQPQPQQGGEQLQLFSPPMMAPPNPADVIPPWPGEQMQLPVSIPGGRPGPTPWNPIQQPGTLSKVWEFDAGLNDQFENGSTARIEESTYGIAEGKSEAHGAGQYREVPKNSVVEVLGQDPGTGWVDVIFPLADSGPMEPFHVRLWIEPEKLTPLNRGTPFVKRRN